ncbi:HOPP1 [Auxenochlorella protothecoides x Auxenochlorella symbiontica]
MADALEKGYLHKCLFGFAADVDAQQLLEQYVFTFSYDPDGCIHMSLAGKGKKFASRHGAAGVESVKKQVCRLMRMLVEVCHTLEPVPDERYLFIKLTYVEGTPADYEPPMFEPAAHRATGCFPRKPFNICVGAVDSNYHAVTLQVKSVLDSLADGVSEGNAVADDQSVQASEAMTGKPKEGRTDAGGRVGGSDSNCPSQAGGEDLERLRIWVKSRKKFSVAEVVPHFLDLPSQQLVNNCQQLVEEGLLAAVGRQAFAVKSSGQGAALDDAHLLLDGIGALSVEPAGELGQSCKRAAEDSCAGGIHSPPGSLQTQSLTIMPKGSRVLADAGTGMDPPPPTYWPESQVSDGRGGQGGGKKVSIVHDPIRQTKRRRVAPAAGAACADEGRMPAPLPPRGPAGGMRTRGTRVKPSYGKLGLVAPV